MSTISSTQYSFISVNFNVVERQDELTYNVLYIYLIYKQESAEVIPQNSGDIAQNVCYISFLCFETKPFVKEQMC